MSAKLIRKSTRTKVKSIEFEDFNILLVLGRGAFGKVYLAELRTNGEIYAVKSIRKDILIDMD